MKTNKYISLDTNILLLNAHNLFAFGKDTILLTETVMSEMDNKKSGVGEIAYNAREFARLMSKAEIKSINKHKDFIETKMLLDSINIVVISNCKYTIDLKGDKNDNDLKIINATKLFKDFYKVNVTMVSNDTYMRLQSIITGLDTTDFKVVEDDGFEFVKEITIEDEEVFRKLHYLNIYDVDPDHKPENFSYKFTCPSIGQMKVATITNSIITVIGKDSERELRKQRVSPCNIEQLLMSKAIQDPTIDIVLVEGQAGSGKSLVTISNAMRLMDTNRNLYDSIIYMRNTIDDYEVGTDENVGYLSTNEAKFAVYLAPIHDTLDYMVRKQIKKGKVKATELEEAVENGIDTLRNKYNIQDMVTLGLRGRTLDNCILCVDEIQNIGQGTMQKLLTRVGKNCKLILTGSNNQIDAKYLTKYNNGMAVLLDYCKNPKFQTEVNVFAINLNRTVRSPVAEFAENLFSKNYNT